MGQWDAFIRGMPKAENHLHFCGIIEPELMLELSRKNRVRLRHNTLGELQDAYQFTNLQSFIDLCIEGTTVVVDESDFYAVTMSYLRHAQAENIIHTEMFFEPQLHMMQGIPIDTMMKGILRALDDGEQHYGISSRLILSVLRNASEEEAFRTLEAVMPYRSKLHGVGLASSELGYPPSRFERFFRHCRELGLHLMAHAGEEGPPAYIEEALDILKVERIDHGVRSIEDERLVRRLAEAGTPLTVCPLSNVRLRVFPTMEDHSIKALMDAGVCVTISSDDPSYFGGYINANYIAVQEAFDLTKEDIIGLARNSFKVSFLSKEERRKAEAKLDAYCSAFAFT